MQLLKRDLSSWREWSSSQCSGLARAHSRFSRSTNTTKWQSKCNPQVCLKSALSVFKIIWKCWKCAEFCCLLQPGGYPNFKVCEFWEIRCRVEPCSIPRFVKGQGHSVFSRLIYLRAKGKPLEMLAMKKKIKECRFRTSGCVSANVASLKMSCESMLFHAIEYMSCSE